ncbi:MAG: hypothetical protein H6745_06700 [Deltaproteobacteria bacterium]|nr:hypothetical protein [Deltaproteobacteria bacterium]
MFSHFSQVLCIVIALVGGSGCFSSPTPHPVDPEDSRVVGVDTTDGLSNETGPPGTGNYDGDSDAQTGGAADALPSDPTQHVGDCDATPADIVPSADAVPAPDCAGEDDDNATTASPGYQDSIEFGQRPRD